MSFEIIGKLVKIYETESKTDSFRAREFVIEIDGGTYPQFVKFQCVQDRTTMIDPYKEGEQIKVHFDLRGREWQGKYFTNLNAWRVEGVSATPTNTAPASGKNPIDASQVDFPTTSDDHGDLSASDDLPF